MNTILRNFSRFATLNAQFLLNKSKNAIRFEAQNIIWDFEEANYQSQAFSKGLASLAFQKSKPTITQMTIFYLDCPQPSKQNRI
jgi:hypothetical protein